MRILWFLFLSLLLLLLPKIRLFRRFQSQYVWGKIKTCTEKKSATERERTLRALRTTKRSWFISCAFYDISSWFLGRYVPHILWFIEKKLPKHDRFFFCIRAIFEPNLSSKAPIMSRYYWKKWIVRIAHKTEWIMNSLYSHSLEAVPLTDFFAQKPLESVNFINWTNETGPHWNVRQKLLSDQITNDMRLNNSVEHFDIF